MKKVVLVTGASSGIGREIAKIFLSKKYSVILTGRNKSGFSYAENNPDADIVIGDLTLEETRNKITNLVTGKYKKLDILVNNAGITFIQPFEENTEEQLDTIYATNLKAPVLLTQGLYPLMKEQRSGTVVFINSAAGKQGYPNHTMYSSMKFALNGFSQSFRLEAKKYGIRVISIHPGGVNTGLYDKLKNKPDVNEYMDAQKLAETVVFLSETSGLSPDEISVNRITK